MQGHVHYQSYVLFLLLSLDSRVEALALLNPGILLTHLRPLRSAEHQHLPLSLSLPPLITRLRPFTRSRL
jgi:hypothetical protein